MKGKSYSIPFGMVFKKYYCHCCGAKLIKSKTHRIVNKHDKDYYMFHEVGNYPKADYDVYDYELKCPGCGKYISFKEQCVVERIQKKYKSNLLSEEQIKSHYFIEKQNDDKRTFRQGFIIISIMNLIVCLLVYLTTNIKEFDYYLLILVTLFLFIEIPCYFLRKRHDKGNRRLRIHQDYSKDEKNKMQILHAYSSHNKELILKSKNCYCFYCKKKMLPKDITNYLKDGTALCPSCDIDSIIPDAILESIDEKTIDKMNKYWF